MDLRQQLRNMAERYRDTVDQREDIRRRQEESGTPFAGASEEQLRARAGRLVRKGEVDPETLAPNDDRPVLPAVVPERILGAASELQSVNFLARGARAARAVARVSIVENGRRAGFGTGFLVGERLLLTNNHVLPDVATATGSFAEFDLESDVDGVPKPVDPYDLAPDDLFVTDPELDYTLVAVAVGSDGRRPGTVHGWLRLIAQQGKIVIGEPVNVVGHPDARPKEIAVRDNVLLNQLPQFLHYRTDTEPGNSGSPVFNDQWEVVALHHAGVPDPDGEGWIANEGARVSSILRDLAAAELSPAQELLLAELGPQAVPRGAAPVGVAATDDRRAGAAAVLPAQAVSSTAPTAAARDHERRGLTGRTGAGRRLVFLHGRGQQGRDPAALRAGWCGGLAVGLAAAGLAPLDAADVWFPYYGDALADAMATRESVAPDTATTTAEAYAPADPGARAVYAALLDEAAGVTGMPAAAREPVADSRRAGQSTPAREGVTAQESGLLGGAVAALQGPLSWIAARSGLDDVVIATVFRDVAAYLDNKWVRDAVLDSVLAQMPDDGEVVLVTHSLGTVVALDLFTRLPSTARVPLLVTAGSPLGLDAVYRRLLAGPVRPGQVGVWINAWAAGDAVAIGCPLGDTWTQVRDVLCANRKDRAHDITQYLSDARVAGEIGRGAR